MKKVAIVDYSIGNIFSVDQACKKVGLDTVITQSPQDVRDAHAVILPGVGAFALGMKNLSNLGLVEALTEEIRKGKPFFGICLGMQLLFESSKEFGSSQGLGLLRGDVISFRDVVSSELPVPKIAWSEIYPSEKSWASSPLERIPARSDVYFVHSFFCKSEEKDCDLALSNYGSYQYVAAVMRDNLFATQFHPEKSGELGLQIYEDWKNKFLL